jgi:hypothetical protein
MVPVISTPSSSLPITNVSQSFILRTLPRLRMGEDSRPATALSPTAASWIQLMVHDRFPQKPAPAVAI